MEINNILVLLFGFIFIALIVIIYFYPSYVARQRNHNNAVAIFILNLFLGWSFLGWVISLVWAFTDNVKKTEPATSEKYYGEPIYEENDKTRREPKFRKPFNSDS